MDVIKQGFTSPDSEYYQIGPIPKNTKENIPIIGKSGKTKLYCARVRELDSTTRAYKYLKAKQLPEEVKVFMAQNNYSIDND